MGETVKVADATVPKVAAVKVPDVTAPKVTSPASRDVAELEAYRQMVADLAMAADGRVIMNRSGEHAAIVIEHIFRSARDQVDILTGKLHAPIYGSPPVVDAAVGFVRSNPRGRIRIISEEEVSVDHPLLRALYAASADVDLRIMTDKMKDRTPFHFAVADGRNFRFEPDKEKYEAYGQFGEPKVGSILSLAFERLHSSLSKK